MRLILSVTLCMVTFVALLAVPQYTIIPVNAQQKQTIYVDTSGIDKRGDLTKEQKDDIWFWMYLEIKGNLESAVGKGNVEVTKDPAKYKDAIRTVYILNRESPDDEPHWGSWPHGADFVKVYLGELMDVTKNAEAFKTGGKWDAMKLGSGIGVIASHELAHSFSAGHGPFRVDAKRNKMYKKFGAKPLADYAHDYAKSTKETIKKNWGAKTCKSSTDPKKKALITDYWGEPLLPDQTSELYGVDALFNFTGLLAKYFYFGILGYDSDRGVMDGNPQFDFIYKSSMEGLGADAEMLTFFVEGAHDYTQFLVVGAPDSTWANKWFMLPEDNLHLYNFVTQPDGDHVARFVVMKWEVDGMPGVDVQVTLDANAFGNYSNPYNGFKYGYPPRPPVGGIAAPINKPATLLVPYIALASSIIIATVATAVYVKHVKRVKRRKKKQ